MKIQFLAIVFSFFLISLKSRGFEFILSGKIINYPTKKVYLRYFLNNKPYIDSVDLNSENYFSFKKDFSEKLDEFSCRLRPEKGASIEIIFDNKDSVYIEIDMLKSRSIYHISKNAKIYNSPKSVEINSYHVIANDNGSLMTDLKDKIALYKTRMNAKDLILIPLYEEKSDSLLNAFVALTKNRFFLTNSSICANGYLIQLRALNFVHQCYKCKVNIEDSINVWAEIKKKTMPIRDYDKGIYKNDISQLFNTIQTIEVYDFDLNRIKVSLDNNQWTLLCINDIKCNDCNISLESYKGLLEKKQVKVITVWRNVLKNSEDIKVLRVKELNTQESQYVNIYDDDLLDLQKLLNIKNSPFRLLLDSNGKVVAVNPPLKTVLEQLK
jgi:hypothetical protein